METAVKLSRHIHPLTPSSGFAFRCYWCKTGGYIKNGYHCNECDLWFHKECGNISFKINHTSHPEHLIRQTNLAYWLRYWCNVCRRRIDNDWGYDCYICHDFSLHVYCARETPPLSITHPQAHVHPLKLFPVSRNIEHVCEVCREKVVVELAYRCFECKVVIHVECVNSQEVNHPSHTKHPLKLLTSGAPDYTDKTCLLCGWKLEVVLYHCSLCNFSLCLSCAIIPPPLDVEHLKTHEHKLTLMARQISFICNACGIQGNHSPYFCLQCDFMVHRSCIGLPRVIYINRHDHRISHTQQLSLGDWRCRICLQSVNRFYGAFRCSVCIDYVVHSQCATRNDVWDGLELEGIPEETEDITPFKEVGDDLINHFSHEEHNLKLNKDGLSHWRRSFTGLNHGESIRCEGCMLPVYFDPVYSCECDQCEFILHETCANLPRKKRHMFHNKKFTLHVEDSPKVLPCSACGEFFNGFRYASDDLVLDVGCISISDFFSTENHPHPLHYNKTYTGKCDACHGSIESGGFSCESCDFNLDFRCVSLPKTVKHICDEHPLSLSCEENVVNGTYWCEICEEKMDPSKWFYTCNACVVTLHVKCVLGDFYRLKPASVVELREEKFVVTLNNHSTRPFCKGCGLRCKVPFVLKVFDKNIYVCSEGCFHVLMNIVRAARQFTGMKKL